MNSVIVLFGRQIPALIATMNAAAVLLGVSGIAADVERASPAAQAMNALGLDLLAHASARNANAVLSPYSIQSALAMTFAGAGGVTRAEMARALHYTGDEAELHRSFAALQTALDEVRKTTAERAENAKQWGGPSEPVTLTVANRLFGQQGFAFRKPFLELVRDNYNAPFQPMDFIRDPSAASREINLWVESQTRQRIRDLIPPDGLDRKTRLVLVNATYLKAPWAQAFPEFATKPRPFQVNGGPARDVPTMERRDSFGFARWGGFRVVTITYSRRDVQFLILLPDAVDGLATLEARLTPDILVACANLREADVWLQLPKFKLQPPLFRLSETLKTLGMKSAFDQPRASANFDRMAPRKADDYLYLSEVFHKTFLALDEQGTEATSATAVVALRTTSLTEVQPDPIEVRVDRPFLFAIQHRPSGACLFLGRVTNPL